MHRRIRGERSTFPARRRRIPSATQGPATRSMSSGAISRRMGNSGTELPQHGIRIVRRPCSRWRINRFEPAITLRQRGKAFEWVCARRTGVLVPVCELFHPMLHADGQLTPADGAYPAVALRLCGTQAEVAVPVAVVMVFSLFWEELDGPREAPPPVCRAWERAG